MKLLIIFFIFISTNLWACEKGFIQSGDKQTAMIELFTSEGCSSCPPAEKWIDSLSGHTDLNKRFFPLAFHVNYWDYIGWKDPFAKQKFTRRQHQYASNWKSDTVYTPGFALNKNEWRVGSRIRKLPKKSKDEVGKLSAKFIKKDEYLVSFENKTKKGKDKLILNYAILGNNILSRVKRGENAGKTLKQSFVVLDYNSESFIDGMRIKLPSSNIKRDTKKDMAVFWLEKVKDKSFVQIAGGSKCSQKI